MFLTKTTHLPLISLLYFYLEWVKLFRNNCCNNCAKITGEYHPKCKRSAVQNMLQCSGQHLKAFFLCLHSTLCICLCEGSVFQAVTGQSQCCNESHCKSTISCYPFGFHYLFIKVKISLVGDFVALFNNFIPPQTFRSYLGYY